MADQDSDDMAESGPGSRNERRAPSNSKRHKCHLCSNSYADRRRFEVHLEKHADDSNFTCPICSRSFACKSYLSKHEMVHTGELPFHCAHCPQRCITKATLEVHMRSHTGERPYPCSYCDKSFSQSSSRVQHEKRHEAGSKTLDRIPLRVGPNLLPGVALLAGEPFDQPGSSSSRAPGPGLYDPSESPYCDAVSPPRSASAARSSPGSPRKNTLRAQLSRARPRLDSASSRLPSSRPSPLATGSSYSARPYHVAKQPRQPGQTSAPWSSSGPRAAETDERRKRESRAMANSWIKALDEDDAAEAEAAKAAKAEAAKPGEKTGDKTGNKPGDKKKVRRGLFK